MNSLLKFFYSPMVMISLVLHGLILLMPLPAQPPAAPPAAELPQPEEAVKLSSVSSLKIAPQPTPSPVAAKPPIRPIARPPVRAIARPQARSAAAAPLPSVQPTASPLPTTAPPAPSPAPSPTEPAVPLSQGQLQSSAVSGVGQASAAQFYSSFPDPAAFFTAESIQQADADPTVEPLPLEGITNMTRLELMDVAQAKAEILPQMFPGATFTPAGKYGDGDVYEVRQGNSVGYVVLVKEASLSKAAYIVEWSRNPNAAQASAQ